MAAQTDAVQLPLVRTRQRDGPLRPVSDAVSCATVQVRVRKLMKSEPAIRAVTQDASFLVTKATEMFLETLTEQALGNRAAEGAAASALLYSDLGARWTRLHTRLFMKAPLTRAPARTFMPATVVAETQRLDFLRDIVPRTTPGGELLIGRAARGAPLGQSTDR